MAVLHGDNPITFAGKFRVMRDDQQRRPQGGATFEKKVDNRSSGRAVQISGRLIRKDNLRCCRHGACNRHPLLLPARKLRRIMCQAMPQSYGLQLCFGPGKGIFNSGKFHGNGDIFERRHGGKQVECLQHDADPSTPRAGQFVLVQLPEIQSVDQHSSAACLFQSRKHRHQRRFTRT